MTVLRTSRGVSLRIRPRALAVTAVCVLVAAAAAVIGIGSGDYPIGPVRVLRALAGGGSAVDTLIVNDLRLPRAVTALLAGAALGLSGAVFQSLTRNALASPDILGVTQGAGAGAVAAIVMAGGGTVAVAGGALAGGLAAGMILLAVAGRDGLHGYRIVLVGVGLAATLTGVDNYLLTRAQLADAARAVAWLVGSLDGRHWGDALPLLTAMCVAVPVILLGHGRSLPVLEMGDDTATALGVRSGQARLVSLGAAMVLASFAAAACGPVAFVALTAPQIARRLTRTPGPNLVAAMCLGAALLALADLVAQRLVPGRQLPVGVVTGALGGCYLLWLIATVRRKGRL